MVAGGVEVRLGPIHSHLSVEHTPYCASVYARAYKSARVRAHSCPRNKRLLCDFPLAPSHDPSDRCLMKDHFNLDFCWMWAVILKIVLP